MTKTATQQKEVGKMPAKQRSMDDGGNPPEYPFSVGDVLQLPDGSTVDVRVGTGVEFLLWPYKDQETTHPSHCTFNGTIFRLAGEGSWPASEATRINNEDTDLRILANYKIRQLRTIIANRGLLINFNGHLIDDPNLTRERQEEADRCLHRDMDYIIKAYGHLDSLEHGFFDAEEIEEINVDLGLPS